MGHHCTVCKKTAKSGCVNKHFWYCTVHPDKTYIKGKECASCVNKRNADAAREKAAKEAEEKKKGKGK